MDYFKDISLIYMIIPWSKTGCIWFAWKHLCCSCNIRHAHEVSLLATRTRVVRSIGSPCICISLEVFLPVQNELWRLILESIFQGFKICFQGLWNWLKNCPIWDLPHGNLRSWIKRLNELLSTDHICCHGFKCSNQLYTLVLSLWKMHICSYN